MINIIHPCTTIPVAGNMREKILNQAKAIVLKQLEAVNARAYLFGSQATGAAGRYSDIDIALLPFSSLPPGIIGLIKEKLEESNIPYSADVVDLSKTDELFKKRVISEGVLWKDWLNE